MFKPGSQVVSVGHEAGDTPALLKSGAQLKLAANTRTQKTYAHINSAEQCVVLSEPNPLECTDLKIK